VTTAGCSDDGEEESAECAHLNASEISPETEKVKLKEDNNNNL
jgi:hypothetical protein